jgi:hypothetical protein
VSLRDRNKIAPKVRLANIRLQMSAQKSVVKGPDNSRRTSCFVQMSAQKQIADS